MKELSIIILIFSSLPHVLHAQASLWQMKFSNGDTISNVILKELKGDSLEVVHKNAIKLIYLDTIIEARNVKKSSVWDGAKIGYYSGSIIGIITGAIFAKPSGALKQSPGLYRTFVAIGGSIYIGIFGGVLGAIIGGIAGMDEVTDLSQMNILMKRTYFQSLLARESNSG